MTQEPLHSQNSIQDQSPKYGLAMMILTWVAILAAFTFFSFEWSEQQFNPNNDVTSTVNTLGVNEVTLEMNRSGHYVATGLINQTPAVYLLDTGATYTVVPRKLAQAIHLKIGQPVTLSTANGDITNFATTIDSLSIGNITLHNVRAVINPNTNDEFILLGMSALKTLELNHRKKVLTIRQHPN